MTERSPDSAESAKTPTEILEEPISDDDLTAEIADAAGGPSKVTIGLLIAVLVMLAFGAGIWVRSTVMSRPSPVTTEVGEPGVLTGTVHAGNTGSILPISGPNGRTTMVTLPPRDRIYVAQQSSTDRLRPGTQVRIEGKPGQGNRFVADRLTIEQH